MSGNPFEAAVDFRIPPGWHESPPVPAAWARQGVAAALVIDRNGNEHVEPVIVVDFYREAEQP